MKPTILYGIGAILIAAGIGCVLESGRRTGFADAKRETWRDATDADDSDMGIVDHARGKRDRSGSPDDAA